MGGRAWKTRGHSQCKGPEMGMGLKVAVGRAGMEVKQGSNCPLPLKHIYDYDFVASNALQIFQEFRVWKTEEGILAMRHCTGSGRGNQASRRRGYKDHREASQAGFEGAPRACS